MPLMTCSEVYGDAEIIDGTPLIENVNDALLIPTDLDHPPGLYSANGCLIRAAAYFRGLPSPHFPLESETTTFDMKKAAFASQSDRYFYAGHFTGHFGHFLFSTLARLWCLPKPIPQDLKIVMLNAHYVADVFKLDFIETILSELGISVSCFAVFREPVRFRNIIVASPSIEENYRGYSAFQELCFRIGRRILDGKKIPDNRHMVYLTKKGLSAGVHRIVNEDAFCMALHRGGVDIVSPELLPFRQQVALWAERPMVGGMSGSMLHTSVFVPQRTYVALNPETWINSNQVMIDRLNGNFARTLYPEDGYARVDGPGSFHHHLQLVDPEGTAKAFLKAMREAESEARRRALRPARYRPAWRHS